MFCKKMFLKMSQISQENTFVEVSFYIKKRLQQNNLKNNYFKEHIWTAAST